MAEMESTEGEAVWGGRGWLAGGECGVSQERGVGEGGGGRWTLRSGARPPPATPAWAQKHGALTTGWQLGPEVDGEPVAPAQVGVVGQCGTQAGLPAAAGVPAALLEVGHGAQVDGAGSEQLPCKHAAGLHRIGGWRQEGQGWGARALVCLGPQA